MANYGHEIPKEINDERLILIKLYDYKNKDTKVIM